MFLKILLQMMSHASAAIYCSVALLANDYFQTGLAWSCEDQRNEIRSKIENKLIERYQQSSQQSFVVYRNNEKTIFSIKAYSRAYDCYFDYATLCESKDNVESIDFSLQRIYNNFLNAVFDGFLSIHQEWHADYNAGIIKICEEGINSSSSEKVKDLARRIDVFLVVPREDRDSVYWYTKQIVLNYQDCPDLPDFNYLVKLIAEIPKEHRGFILKEKACYPESNKTTTWLRVIRQANVNEYYAPLMYKFISFINPQSFWSIFVSYSYSVPTEEHLINVFKLFHERIIGAYIIPKSQEATKELQLYLKPWYPVGLVHKIRSSKVLDLCW